MPASRPSEVESPSLAATLIVLLAFTCAAVWRESVARYAGYAIPAIITLDLFLRNRRVQFDTVQLLAVCLLSTYIAIHGLVFGFSNTSALVVSALLLSVVKFSTPKWALNTSLALMISIQFGLALSKGIDLSAINVLSSDAIAETDTLPFIIAALGVPYIVKKKWYTVIIVCAALILGGKRIVIISYAFAALGSFIYFSRIGAALRSQTMSATVWAMSASFMLFLALLMQTYVREILNNFQLNADVFTSGRYIGQGLVYRSLETFDWPDWILGRGAGLADYLAMVGWSGGAKQVHNDYLRAVVDWGLLGYSMIVACYYLALRKSIYVWGFLPALLALWMSDNTMTYAFFGSALIIASRAD